MKKIIAKIFATNIRVFVLGYLFFTIFGALLLMSPFSLKENVSIKFVDALFVSVSSMSTTGLTTVIVADTFSVAGQVILALLIQFGGIGLIMLIAFVWFALGTNIGYKKRQYIVTDQNQVRSSQVVKLVKDILFILFIVESIMFVIIGFYLYFNNYFDFGEAFFQSFFLTISMTANAGFDITGDSLFRYNNDYGFQSMAMLLMFFGAVGFWPLVEFKDYVKAKIKKKNFEFSQFTKILFFMHVGLWIFGALVIFLLERNNYLLDKSIIEKFFLCMFNSLTARNAGFATMEVANFISPTLLFISLLMFIGSSPNSAGGGIRTTTLVVVIASLFSFSKNRKQVVIGKRALKDSTISKALSVFITGWFLVILSSFLILMVQEFTLEEVLFEVTSAFGTTGLSLGITSSLNTFSKLVIIITMFIGRIGIVALLMFFKGNKDENNIKYPEIDLIVG